MNTKFEFLRLAKNATNNKFGVLAVVASVVFFAGLPKDTVQAVSVRNAEDLMVVDCLLPGQVRKLGSQSSFIAPRRPIRTIQSDCQIRGGEYVAFDRADYQTALKVWLQQAQTGDAEAQNYVGEIYAKGLGTAPDYMKAMAWYNQSIAQGNRRAMINMGYLYEQGLGVEQDLTKALNLYRQGAGVKDELLFSSTVTAQAKQAEMQITDLKRTVETQKQEAEKLKEQLGQAQQKLKDHRRALQTAEHELNQVRSDLVDKQASLTSGENAVALKQLKQHLDDEQNKITQERAQLEKDRANSQQQWQLDQLKLIELRAREAALVAKTTQTSTTEAAVRQDLERVRAAASELALALDAAFEKMDSMQKQLVDNERKLVEQQTHFESERKKLQSAIQVSQQDRDLLQLLERQLSEKQRQVSTQRQQISSLEGRVSDVALNGQQSGSALASGPGPLLEIISPPLTATRGKAAAMVPASASRIEVLGKVISRVGLNQMSVNGQDVAVGANGLFKVNVPIQNNDTAVHIFATDRAGVRTAFEFTLFAQQSSARAQGQVLAVGSQQIRAPRNLKLGRYYAVVIGNNEYQGGYSKLVGAVHDAQKMADVLKRKYGFETRLILNGSRFDLLSSLNEMRETLRAEDNLVVYFAGHGEIDAQSKQGYWIPVDGQIDTPSTWISNRAISDILNTMQAKHVMVMADSCYSGAMTRASLPAFNAALSDEQRSQWIKNMNASRSRTALTSGGLAPVPDANSGSGSLFAKALVTALEDNNQLLEGQRLFRTVSTQIALESEQTSLLQSPEYAPIQFAGHEAGEFFFTPKG